MPLVVRQPTLLANLHSESLHSAVLVGRGARRTRGKKRWVWGDPDEKGETNTKSLDLQEPIVLFCSHTKDGETGRESMVAAKSSHAGPSKHPDAVDLSASALGSPHIKVFGRHFVDGYGRILQPRGFNVSGASKMPTKPNGLSHLSEGFFEHETVSFVGRPFPLDEAPFHLARLRAWGHTLIRLLVTWESLGHSGPDPSKDLDNDYIEYLASLLTLMDEHGFRVIICAHQDVWSRFSGGSGAPGWTFAKAGLDIECFKATGAAFVHNLHGDEDGTRAPKAAAATRSKEPVGAFVWPSGYEKLAAATMATLFWGGDIFAWQLRLPHFDQKRREASETLSIQQFLQEAFIETFGVLIDRVGHLAAVVGVDLINEPHRGYIGLHGWHQWCYETDLHIGHFPSALQGMALGSGYRQRVPFYVKSWPWPTRCTHKSVVDPLGKSAWLQDEGMKQCIWRAHGAWQWDDQREQPVVLVDDYFSRDPRPGKDKQRIEWYRDCYAPFIAKFTNRIRRKHKHLFSFVEPIPNEFMPPWSSNSTVQGLDDHERILLMKSAYDQRYATKTFIDTPRPSNFVYAPHFYDLNVLFGKKHGTMSVNVQALSRGEAIIKAIFFGNEGLKKNYKKQITKLVECGKTSLGAVPTVIGEVGIPFDINGAEALQTGDYKKHLELYDALIEAMEASEVAFTLWNYNPDNTVAYGDGWNQEDFSVVCTEKQALDAHNDVVGRDETEVDVSPRRKADNWSQAELHLGGRALTAIIRPYAVKVAGYPLKSSWDREKRVFEFEYANPPPGFRESAIKGADSVEFRIESSDSKGSGRVVRNAGSAAIEKGPLATEEARTTQIFLPRYHFDGLDVRIQAKDGTYTFDREGQTLSVRHENDTPGFTHVIRVSASENALEAKSNQVQGLLARRAHNLRRRRGRIPLTAQDICALLGVAVCFGLALALSFSVSTVMRVMDEGGALDAPGEGTMKRSGLFGGRRRGL